MNKIRVSLEFDVEIYEKGNFGSETRPEFLKDVNLAEYLENEIRDWEEGRCPFESEMLLHSLNLLCKTAIARIIIKQCKEKYGDERVEMPYKCTTARYNVEAQKEIDRYTVWVNDAITAKLTSRPETS